MLVVARYNEDIEWTKHVSIPVTIYNKGEPLEGSIPLPNIGREAHTYLTYIVENYDSLPDKVFFTQGNPFPHSPNFLQRLRDGILEEFEFFSLCKIDTELTRKSRSHAGIEPALHSMFEELVGYTPKTMVFPSGALFGFSKSSIQKYPLSFWKSLLQKCIESEQTPNCIYDVHSKPCGCLNPYSAWCMERLWMYL